MDSTTSVGGDGEIEKGGCKGDSTDLFILFTLTKSM